jgi:tRNA modification GTPase
MGDADTIAAIATASGRGGIGVVRVSGRDLRPLCLGILGLEPSSRKATLCAFRDAAGESIDTGIALLFPGPHSFTGETVLELQGHGGPIVLHLLLERCVELGARLAQPGEFTRRAYLNDKLDLAQAEAVADLIDATTVQAARSAHRSLRGEFSQRIHQIQHELTTLRMLVEATLDFPEEEIEFLERADAMGKLERLRSNVRAVLETARQGQLLREGIRVVLAGRPNVGKSSLINRLSGDDVAIVTEHPGTTRDLIRQYLQIRGVPVHLVDSAGLRETTDPVERIGIDRTWREIAVADVVILVIDAESAQSVSDREIERQIPSGIPRIRVHNKIDLIGRTPGIDRRDGETEVWLSARTGAGMNLLTDQLLAIVGWTDLGESTCIARARHVHALSEAAEHLGGATDALHTLDVLAEELRLCQRALSRITGEVTADELLGEIFSRFCIGK